MKSKPTILTSGSEIIATNCLESPPPQKGGGNEWLHQRERTFLKGWYKYFFLSIVVKVNGQSIYSMFQKKQRNVFQSSTRTLFMAPTGESCAFDTLFSAPVSSIQPWTVKALSVKTWIFFTSFTRLGSSQSSGSKNDDSLHLMFTTNDGNIFVTRTGLLLLLQPYFGGNLGSLFYFLLQSSCSLFL